MIKQEDFDQYLDEFNKITKELASIEVKIEEMNRVLPLLDSFPLSFDNIMTAPFFPPNNRDHEI